MLTGWREGSWVSLAEIRRTEFYKCIHNSDLRISLGTPPLDLSLVSPLFATNFLHLYCVQQKCNVYICYTIRTHLPANDLTNVVIRQSFFLTADTRPWKNVYPIALDTTPGTTVVVPWSLSRHVTWHDDTRTWRSESDHCPHPYPIDDDTTAK